MSEFFEYSPDTGIRTDLSWCERTQEMTLIRTADVEPVLDFTKACANEAGLNREGIREGWWLYCKLPPIVILQMRAKGINVFDQNDQKRMFEEINQNYKFLKCTTGNEGSRSSRKLYMPPNVAGKNTTDGGVTERFESECRFPNFHRA